MASLYEQSIPVMIKYLDNFSALLAKGAKHCEEKNIAPEETLNFKLCEDMRPLIYQVHSVCNTAKFLAVRVFNHPDEFFPDDEVTFPDLQSRLAYTIKFLESVVPPVSPTSSLEEKSAELNREILMETRAMGKYKFTAQNYVSEFAIPNFHFHLTTGYCILRHLGVNVGAFDYLRGCLHKVE